MVLKYIPNENMQKLQALVSTKRMYIQNSLSDMSRSLYKVADDLIKNVVIDKGIYLEIFDKFRVWTEACINWLESEQRRQALDLVAEHVASLYRHIRSLDQSRSDL